jgi:GWxTD domain-containing protein
MRFLLLLIILFYQPLNGVAQALRDINYRYQYNPEENLRFVMNTVRGAEQHTTYFRLQMLDSITPSNDYTIEWQLRDALSDKTGKTITSEDTKFKNHEITGSIHYPVTAATVVVAKVISAKQNRAWNFYQIQDKNYPVNDILLKKNEGVYDPYINAAQSFTIPSDGGARTVSFYSQNFPTAVPPFAESQGRVSKGMKPNSVFSVQPGQQVSFTRKGLYLMQKDSASNEGYAFRVEDDYPRLATVESLADPLIYICTKEEFTKVKQAKGDKKAFDKVILGITGDKDRARNLFRSYFKRVEMANVLFSSYKEGWKTDRGMIYIIFGVPDAVYKFTDREVWNYKNDSFKVDFTFVRSSTLFDPENYVLVREKSVKETWYEVIDLWRNARF